MPSLLFAITFFLWRIGAAPLEPYAPADLLKGNSKPTTDITISSPTPISDESDYGSHLDPNGRS